MNSKLALRIVALAAAIVAGQSMSAEIFPPVAKSPDALALISDFPPVQLPAYYVRPGVPSVTRLLEPRISTDYLGRQLELRFVVNQAGRAEGIVAVNVGSDLNLVAQLAAAIKGWEFEPARNAQGLPFDCTVILPVEIGAALNLEPREPKGGPVRLSPYYVRVNYDEPSPLQYVIPRVGPEYIGERVLLRFVVDRTGRPYDIDAVGPANRNFVAQLTSAISGWKFDPARDAAGNPVERAMLLPIEIE